MTNTLDCQFGLKKESAYGTPVVVDRFLEFKTVPFKKEKGVVQGEGMRVGSRTDRADRRTIPFSFITGSLELDAITKGMGVLWEACMGAGTSTLVSAGLYQQVFTWADVMPSYTCQVGTWDGTEVNPQTFAGCQVGSWTLNATEAGIVSLSVTWIGKSLDDATALAIASYPVGATSLYTFAHAAFYAGGTLTAPTATTLGSATGSALAVVKNFSLSQDNGLKDGPQVGGLSTVRKPTKRAATGTMEVEYSGSTFLDAINNDTSLPLVATFTNGTDVLQLILPEVRLEGEPPAPNGSERITHPLNFKALEGAAAQAVWVVTRTADAAL